MEPKIKTIQFGDSDLTFETGQLAVLANGAVLARWGETVILVTVTMSEPREGIDFFPLTVEYVERLYAGGLISSSRFVKRERFPSPEATLKARVIDRSIRPLFPKGFMNEVQIIVTVLSFDDIHDPAQLAINATSAALMISDIPFEGPVAGIRISLKNDEFLINPNIDDYEKSDLDLMVSTSRDSVIMLEAGANQVAEEKMLQALRLVKDSAEEMLYLQLDIAKEWGRPKSEFASFGVDEEMRLDIFEKFGDAIKDAVYLKGRVERYERFDQIHAEAYLEYEGKYAKSEIDRVINAIIEQIVVDGVIKENKRPDGRAFDEVRPLFIKTGILPRTHGSGIFQRGLTQTLTTVTLASGRQEQLLEDLAGETTKRYMHHYNFKPFTTGETGRYSFYPGRREIGHGALGERALIPVIPSREEFPYTIRVVSEILSANGSTSMAAACGSTIALMDAGIPIKSPVAGIAMGLMKDEETGKVAVLTDIQGFEDHFGDMDFKITGTRKGITALQMDNKLKGISIDTLHEAMEKAKTARLKILDSIEAVISKPREQLSKYAPRIKSIKIDSSKIGDVIGPGGSVIRKITEETGAEVDIEEDGTVNIASITPEGMQSAEERIRAIVFEPEIGAIYDATVSRIEPYGAFVSITPTVSGLVHVSELSDKFIKDPNEVVKLGQEVRVKVVGVDERGRVNLSVKQAIAE